MKFHRRVTRVTAPGGPRAHRTAILGELNLYCTGSVRERAPLAGAAKRQELFGARPRGAGLARRGAPPQHELAQGPGGRRRG